MAVESSGLHQQYRDLITNSKQLPFDDGSAIYCCKDVSAAYRLSDLFSKMSIFENGVEGTAKAIDSTLVENHFCVFVNSNEAVKIKQTVASNFASIIAKEKTIEKTIPSTSSNSSVKKPTNINAILKTVPKNCIGLFSDVNSSKLLPSNGKQIREHFLQDPYYHSPAPVISKSHFVPEKMTEHLMRRKKDSALCVKYCTYDAITNMEGAMHSFVTPVVKIRMTKDYNFYGAVDLKAHREVIMSAAIHPDFECAKNNEVVMHLVEAKQTPLQGIPLPKDFVILAEKHSPASFQFKQELPRYEQTLASHMVYHLTKDHYLPSVNDIKAMSPQQAQDEIETIIKNPHIVDVAPALQGKFVNLNNHVISLEALYNIYLNQIVNEFSILEGVLPQGYVYTIDPPSIFAAQINSENTTILNRLQLLAIKEVNQSNALKNLKILGFCNYKNDSTIMALYKQALPNINVCNKEDLFKGPKKEYSNTDGYALVEHNNSDAFGQNIETEGSTSKDGVLGVNSDAAHTLKRNRADLTSHVF